ncbi:hypothetical protein BC833DRAFT_576302 [Globomyces pollinis-pini]|nr:hypothetical protein BC833DRAFT_576302 [Globomyces pollinis-pini]
MESVNGYRKLKKNLERMCTISQNSNYKISIIVDLAGPILEMIEKLPMAFMMVMNTHPRMRSKLIRNVPFTCTIQDNVSMEEVEPLISVIHVVDDEWKKYVQDECNIPFDRYTQYPYNIKCYLQNEQSAKLVIYADHYMSDGVSAMHIFNDLCQYICNPNLIPMMEPLTKNIYTLQNSKLKRIWESIILKMSSSIIRYKLKSYKPVFDIDCKQKPFRFPLPSNPSQALFHHGHPDNMKNVLNTCKSFNVSVNSAVIVSLLLSAFYVSNQMEMKSNLKNNGKFKMVLDCAFDMRRLSRKSVNLKVGAFSATTPLHGYANRGLDLDTNFWLECQRAKKEMVKYYHLLSMTLGCIDLFFSHENGKPFLENQPGCIMSDMNISNIGKYPFPASYQLNNQSLQIKGCFAHCASSHMAAGCNVYFVGTNVFSYSMSYKFEESVSKMFFDTFVKVTESIGTIQKHETIRMVIDRILI